MVYIIKNGWIIAKRAIKNCTPIGSWHKWSKKKHRKGVQFNCPSSTYYCGFLKLHVLVILAHCVGGDHVARDVIRCFLEHHVAQHVLYLYVYV